MAQPRAAVSVARAAIAVLAAVFLGLAGCSSHQAPAPDGGAPDGGRAICANVTCGLQEVCSLGRCTTVACQMEEDKRPPSSKGCLFYTLDADNVTADAPLASSVLVTNPSTGSISVKLRQRNAVDKQWTDIRLVTLGDYEAERIVLPASAATGEVGLNVGVALQISASAPIFAAHVQSDDAAETAGSSGGTFLLPAHVLGRRYMVMTYPQSGSPKVSATAGSRKGAGQIIMVGTADQTIVRFTLSGLATLDESGGTRPLGRNEQTTLTISDGDVFQIFSVNQGDDLSGSSIESDRPLAVFSGNISTTYGLERTPGINSPDMAHEQMLPTALWGTEYVTASLPPQLATCDGFFSPPESTLMRVLAAEDETRVEVEAPAGVTVTGPRGEPVDHLDLQHGEVAQLGVAGGSVRVTSNRRVLVTEGMDCEASLSSAIATSEMLTYFRFAVLPHFEQMIAVVRVAGDTVTLDAEAIDPASFRPVGGGFEIAHVELPLCPSALGVCPHLLSGGRFGVSLRGMDVLSSYAMTAPTWVCDVSTGCVD